MIELLINVLNLDISLSWKMKKLIFTCNNVNFKKNIKLLITNIL